MQFDEVLLHPRTIYFSLLTLAEIVMIATMTLEFYSENDISYSNACSQIQYITFMYGPRAIDTRFVSLNKEVL
jgi:hypothetical protein